MLNPSYGSLLEIAELRMVVKGGRWRLQRLAPAPTARCRGAGAPPPDFPHFGQLRG